MQSRNRPADLPSPYSSALISVAVAVAVVLIAEPSAYAQPARVSPVRQGDTVEVNVLKKWYPAEVLEFYESGHAAVRYQWADRDYTEKKSLEEIRFPNDEGLFGKN